MDKITLPINEDDLMRYFDKEMLGPERLLFEKELAKNQDLREELASLEATRNAIHLFGIRQQVAQVRSEMKNLETQAPVVKLPPKRKIWMFAVAAACVGLLFLGINKFMVAKPSGDALFAEQFIRFEAVNTRGGETEIDPMEKAYSAKNDDETIAIFNSNKVHTAKQQIMAGVAYLETGKTNEAIVTFKAFIANNEFNKTALSDDAKYYLALAYLKNKDYKNTLQLMQEIKVDANNIYNKKFDEGFIESVKKLQ